MGNEGTGVAGEKTIPKPALPECGVLRLPGCVHPRQVALLSASGGRLAWGWEGADSLGR